MTFLIPKSKCKKTSLGIPLEKIFYLGELVLANKHRGTGVPKRLYQCLEKNVGDYNMVLVCEIERDLSKSKSSVNKISSGEFWDSNAYTKYPDLHTYYSWKDIGDLEETQHQMEFWGKIL